MKKTQEGQFDMMVVTDRFSDTITQAMKDRMPQYGVTADLFKQVVRDIRINIGAQSLDRTGKQVEKTGLRELITKVAVDVATKAQNYAFDVNNQVLFNEVNYNKSLLTSLSDVEFEAAANIILSKANDNSTELVRYEVTAAMLLDLLTQLGLYEEAVPTPKIGINTRKAATTAVLTLIRKGNGYLKIMDRKIKSLRVSEPDFCAAYFAARLIGRPGFHVLSMRGQVKDETGNPLALVRISCSNLGIKRKASMHGRFTFKNLPEGAHEFTFERVGHSTIVVSANIFAGVRTELPVVMELH